MRRLVTGAARRATVGVDRSLERLSRLGPEGDERFVALIYHRVGGRTPSPVDLPLDRFRQHLDYLAAARSVVGLAEALAGSGTAGERVVITFDDGTQDWVDAVVPELVSRQMPAVFYVSTDFVERGRPFPADGRPVSWVGLAEMVSTGVVTIGSHTHRHQVLARCTSREAIDEIDRSVALIEDRLQVPCRHFAYPKAIAPSPAAEVVVRRRFDSAVLAGNRANAPGADRYRLGRHGITVADDLASYERKVAGGGRFEGWLRERRDAWVERRSAA